MKRLLAVLAFVLSALLPSVAGAGGWAVASLDPVPLVRAGRPVDIGFVLLQHGQTPVVAGEWPGSTIGLGVRADGREWFVPATMVGEPGHYVATVDVPAGVSGVAVSVQMHDGLAVDERWADLTAQGGTAGGGPIPTWTVPLLALAAVGCAGTIVVDVRSTRRRRDAAAATPAT
ncbi:MAG: hypothetical protein ABW219_12850 [Ilumatobacteraceae bacterium]